MPDAVFLGVLQDGRYCIDCASKAEVVKRSCLARRELRRRAFCRARPLVNNEIYCSTPLRPASGLTPILCSQASTHCANFFFRPTRA